MPDINSSFLHFEDAAHRFPFPSVLARETFGSPVRPLTKMNPVQINGKIDTKLEREPQVVSEIRRAFETSGGDGYLCTYGDDPAGDLAIKIEHGDALQTVVIEVHSWPQGICDRIRRELSI
jgi:hypothetical protein